MFNDGFIIAVHKHENYDADFNFSTLTFHHCLVLSDHDGKTNRKI